MEEFKNKTFVGVVEDNNDPKKLGRCKVRVLNVFEEIPVEDLPWATPWKDLNGNTFVVPDVGKVVSVVFDAGNIYKPEFIFAEHFNANLQKKLNELSGSEYTSMRALMFDHSTQVYRTESEGLKLDHEYTNVNLDPYGNILLNLRDNSSIITLGSRDADEQAMLGTTFMDWFDEFISYLVGENGGAFTDSSTAPIIPKPGFIDTVLKYQELRTKFVSNHVRLPKNSFISPQNRSYINQKGDDWKSTKSVNEVSTSSGSSYQPSSTFYSETTGKEEEYKPVDNTKNPADKNPSDYKISVSYEVPHSSLDKTKFQNGKIPSSSMIFSQWANGDKNGKWISTAMQKGSLSAQLIKEAAESFDALFSLYEATDFPGKCPLSIVDCYRTYETQVYLKAKLGGFAATPGTSNHGWGIAVDIGGIASPYTTIKKAPQRASAFRTPVYQWLFENAWKFGIYNPIGIRSGGGYDEYWHWEFHGNKGEPPAQLPTYAKPFTREDLDVLRKNNVTSPADKYINTYFS